MKMNLITVEKKRILEIIKRNKENHVEEYKEAMKGYRVGVVAGLEKLMGNIQDMSNEVELSLEEARNGGKLKTSFSLDVYSPFTDLIKPESHEKEYETVIGMIELDTGVEVELDRGEYRNYVQDDWDWSDSFNQQVSGSLYNVGRYGASVKTINSYGE